MSELRIFASVNQSNVLYCRTGRNYSQYFKSRFGGETVEMEKLGEYDYRAVFSDGRMTVIPAEKLPYEWEGWCPMPKMYFPSKGDWDHMATKIPPVKKKKKAAPRKRKMTLAEMLEEMENA